MKSVWRSSRRPASVFHRPSGRDHTKMRHRHHVIADLARWLIGKRLPQMQAQLMSEKVEIDPSVRRPALNGAQARPE